MVNVVEAILGLVDVEEIVIGPVMDKRSLSTFGDTAIAPSNVVGDDVAFELPAYNDDFSKNEIVSDADVGKSKNQFVSAGRKLFTSSCKGFGGMIFDVKPKSTSAISCTETLVTSPPANVTSA